MFQGIAAIEITTEGTALNLSLRLSKKEGVPIQLVPEGTPGASVVVVKRVDELRFYNLGAKQLAEHLKLTVPKVVAIVEYLDLRNDPECHKEIKIGKTSFKRYSQKATYKIKETLEQKSIEEIWSKHGRKRRGAKR
ncbi:MAG: hypothetical protein RMM17_04105 [Acidobacteriota bacterium]|nr:hypothetical protein [Blastocatellia bacterium]MDW8411846.1 hypothetical protein [Acidobacteriota bacterium]